MDDKSTLQRYNLCSPMRDHKPTEFDEALRINSLGGRIECYVDPSGRHVGPKRVWLKNENVPGLAMSRSMG